MARKPKPYAMLVKHFDKVLIADTSQDAEPDDEEET